MKKTRWRAVLKAKGYYLNKSEKFWGSSEHIFYYNSYSGSEVLEQIKAMEQPECWGCGGDGLNTNNEACIVCEGKGWTNEY